MQCCTCANACGRWMSPSTAPGTRALQESEEKSDEGKQGFASVEDCGARDRGSEPVRLRGNAVVELVDAGDLWRARRYLPAGARAAGPGQDSVWRISPARRRMPARLEAKHGRTGGENDSRGARKGSRGHAGARGLRAGTRDRSAAGAELAMETTQMPQEPAPAEGNAARRRRVDVEAPKRMR